MSGFQQKYLEAKTDYDLLGLTDLDAQFATLISTSSSQSQKTAAIDTIKTYTNRIQTINTKLQAYLSEASQTLSSSTESTSEIRYTERQYPEETIEAREISNSIFPKMNVNSIPLVLSAGIFMAVLSIFMIFQTFGVTGQLNIPPAWLTPAIGAIPFYKDPMILGGFTIVLVISTIVFAIMYFTK
jgi:hypothetical protein